MNSAPIPEVDAATGALAVRPERIRELLRRLVGRPVDVLGITGIAEDRADGELKQVGYGEPALVSYRVDGEPRRAVFRTMGPNWFGHDRRSDRANMALLAADTYDEVPRHIRVLDVGALDRRGELVSLRDSGEFYLLTTYVDGELYAKDLRRIERERAVRSLDVARAQTLASYLAELHRQPMHDSPKCYERAIRDLIGSGEGIFGIADSYPHDGEVSIERVAAIEQQCVALRTSLRRRTHRLRRTHGDFHPYNLLFREGVDFSVLDASRGGVGDPADDVAALAINYFFGAAVHTNSWDGALGRLWQAFFDAYLGETKDDELLEVIAPFLAWRALVLASPVWYPGISPTARDTILRLAEGALASSRFEPDDAHRLLTTPQA